MAENKRVRATNFSNEEKVTILNLIKKYKHMIECKESGVNSWKIKEQGWKMIEEELNSCSTCFRSAEVLKRFLNNKKKEVRKQAANVRLEMNKTGGGVGVPVCNDPVYNLTLDIINKKTIFGLQNKFDDDATCSGTEIVEDSVRNNIEDGIENVESDKENEIYLLEFQEEENPLEDERVEKLENLKTPKTKKANTGSNYCQPRQRIQPTKSGNIALRYEEVAELKKEVMQSQLKVIKMELSQLEEKIEWEKKQGQVTEKREKEEHELRKRGLELDLQIKMAQLKALTSIESE